jgi:ComF family protein
MPLFPEILLQFLIPSQCPCCHKFLEEKQQRICSDCLSKIHWIELPYCSVCGIPFDSKEVGDHPCGTCITEKKYFTMARALGSYKGSLREVIHRWKYQESSYLSGLFGEWMEKGLRQYWPPSFFDLFIPVPLHKKRLKERGFNQALLLAKELSHRTGIPYRKKAIQKIKYTLPQVKLGIAEREKGVKGAFHLVEKEVLRGKTILLIDDVYTTGATANECSKILLAGGAARVDVFTLAHALKLT